MDKRKSILNVGVSVSTKVILMVMVIVVKHFLISYCGNEMNGLNALYISIIGFLSVADLGVGTAISFCMYKPVVEKEQEQVCALFMLFRRVYYVISGIIVAGGIAIMPFLGILTKDYSNTEENLYLTFFIMLVSVVLTYFFSAETSLINAHKNNYITTAISSVGFFVQYSLQIVTLVLTHSFVWYLLSRVFAALLQWLLTVLVARKKYYSIITNKKAAINEDTKGRLIKSIKAMFMHKIGYILVNTVDSIVISAFVGVVALGEYSNYTMISTSMIGIISLIFTSLTSVIGHLCVQEDSDVVREYSKAFHLVNYMIGVVFFLGYYAIIDDLISLFFSPDLVAVKSIPFVITVNGFIQFMRSSVSVFRDATGTFYNDRWKPVLEGSVNIILSILMVNYIGVTGVIIATIITNLLICHVVEPYVLYKNFFGSSVKKYYVKNYSLIAFFVLALWVLSHILRDIDGIFLSILVNGTISVGVSLVVIAIVSLFDKKSLKFILRFFKR